MLARELLNPVALSYCLPMKKKNPHAVKLGRLGGLARAKKLSKEELHKIAVMGGKKGGRPKKKLDTGKP